MSIHNQMSRFLIVFNISYFYLCNFHCTVFCVLHEKKRNQVDKDVADQKTMQADEHSQRKAASRQFNANCLALSQ